MRQIENNLQNVRIKTNYIDNDIKCKWLRHSKWKDDIMRLDMKQILYKYKYQDMLRAKDRYATQKLKSL